MTTAKAMLVCGGIWFLFTVVNVMRGFDHAMGGEVICVTIITGILWRTLRRPSDSRSSATAGTAREETQPYHSPSPFVPVPGQTRESRPRASESFFDRLPKVIALTVVGTATLCCVTYVIASSYKDELARSSHIQQYNHWGVKYFSLGRYDEAVTAFTKASEVDPWRPSSFMNRGRVYMKTGKWDKAILDFSKAIDLMEHCGVESGPTNREKVYYWRGVAMHKSGNSDQAIKDWTTVMRLRPFAVKASKQRERLVQRLEQTGTTKTDLVQNR